MSLFFSLNNHLALDPIPEYLENVLGGYIRELDVVLYILLIKLDNLFLKLLNSLELVLLLERFYVPVFIPLLNILSKAINYLIKRLT
mmetsp:Transcript_16982/g.2801  ORF Transcript_16982/g.2801 Transcript_16982/m.2801 type:complete len:87 (-) Transcript_16982:913-1173(-)